jgi:uncharacterized RDD family membrane protein YckC
MIEADGGTRFLNNIIDKFGIMFLVVLTRFLFDGFYREVSQMGSGFFMIYFFTVWFGYYYLTEYYVGKTPAKYITNTLVVDANGDIPTSRAIAIRTLCRLIPFDNLSFVFASNGWHDSLSETRVVRIVDRGPYSEE